MVPEDLNILQPSCELIDPHICSDAKNKLNLLIALVEPLIQRGAGGTFVPVLAERWHLAADARTWTFHLRQDVRFHNGETLEAADVVQSLARILDPSMVGELGTSGVYRSYVGDAQVAAQDDHTVQVVTPEPMADLLDLLVEMRIVPRSCHEDLPEGIIGSGPFRLTDVQDGRVIMERFGDYWGNAPRVNGLTWRAEPNGEQRLVALQSGAAAIVTDIPPVLAHRFEPSEEIRLIRQPSSTCIVFMLNMNQGICTDKRVRQALNYALDVDELIRMAAHGFARPLNGPLTPLHLAHNPITPKYPCDPARARALLSEAGYSEGLELTLDVPTIVPDEAPELAQAMARRYERIGITTTVRVFEDRSGYADMVRNKQLDDGCCFDSSPLSSFRVLREKFHSGIAGPWWQGYQNADVDRLLDRAFATPDMATRRDLYRAAYQHICDDAPWLFLYSPDLVWGSRVSGWQPDPNGLLTFT